MSASTITSDEQFNRFSISSFDFERALEFANGARDHPANSLTYDALLFAAIVSYYRPFTPNERNPGASATKKVLLEDFPALTSSERALHDKCKALRNEALAHSAWNRNPTRFNHDTGIVASKPFSLLSPSFDLEGFVRLVEKLRAACERIRGDYVIRTRA